MSDYGSNTTVKPIGYADYTSTSSSGIRTSVFIDTNDIAVKYMDSPIWQGSDRAVRMDKDHWMRISAAGNGQYLLQIHDETNKFNCRALINKRTGQVSVLRGVDYASLGTKEDAANTAKVAKEYFDRFIKNEEPLFSDSSKNMRSARDVFAYLSKFKYMDNDIHTYPWAVEKRGTLDCDDHATYAYVLLRQRGIPALIAFIRNPNPENDAYACCLFKPDNNWSWMDYRKVGSDESPDYRSIPAMILKHEMTLKRDVRFYIVDVENTWLIGKEVQNENWEISPY
jgi:hypothetical protein